MYNNIFMIEKGVYPKESENQVWVTFLAGAFRSMRFGIGEAHGGGNAIIYNYLLEKGGFVFDESNKKVRVDFVKIYVACQRGGRIGSEDDFIGNLAGLGNTGLQKFNINVLGIFQLPLFNQIGELSVQYFKLWLALASGYLIIIGK